MEEISVPRRGNNCYKGLQVGTSEGLRSRKNAMWLEASKGRGQGRVGEVGGDSATEGFADLGEEGVLF